MNIQKCEAAMIKLEDGRTVYGIKTEDAPDGYIALFAEDKNGYPIRAIAVDGSILVKVLEFLGAK